MIADKLLLLTRLTDYVEACTRRSPAMDAPVLPCSLQLAILCTIVNRCSAAPRQDHCTVSFSHSILHPSFTRTRQAGYRQQQRH